jgi:hypothetical protein
MLFTAAAGACLLLTSTASHAEPAFTGTPGAQIYANGHVTVDIMQSYSGFSNAIALLSPGFSYIGQDEWTGNHVDLGTFSGCPELVFGIFSPESWWSGGSYGYGPFDAFVMGPGSRNGDGLIHASVNFLDPHTALIGFEDLYGPGPHSDRDFNDAIIKVSGVSATCTPEPASLALLATGALPLLRRRLRRRQPEA